ncbi:MAG: hypothetical protein D3903_16995 [Candidatus Electrothrix sp. GM3_4]|nr:hypothetical protein [Candidatus Electrothrix sp. GM3_4]
MLKYFSVKNFRSIREECILEFDENISDEPEFITNYLVGFSGANASGKTTILLAISFTFWFMQNSFRMSEGNPVPVISFYGQEEEPTIFHIIFTKATSIDGIDKLIDYEYSVEIKNKNVINEYLAYYPSGVEETVYLRKGKKIQFGDTAKSTVVYITDFEDNLRENCSIVSYAALYKTQFVARQCCNYNFISSIPSLLENEMKFSIEMLKEIDGDENKRELFLDLLKIADIGIVDFSYESYNTEELEKILDYIRREKENEKIEKDIERYKNDGGFYSASFYHYLYGEKVRFSPEQESEGTLQFVAICYRILNALEKGTLLIIDEVELKLHQNLIAYLIGLFQNEHTNKYKSQLIFSFHNSLLMKFLKPEQLWFAEKNDNGSTELFSASHFDDIDDMNNKDLEKLYRIGRFGAKPRGI